MSEELRLKVENQTPPPPTRPLLTSLPLQSLLSKWRSVHDNVHVSVQNSFDCFKAIQEKKFDYDFASEPLSKDKQIVELEDEGSS